MAQKSRDSDKLVFPRAKKKALYSLIANAPKGVNFHTMREVFGLDSQSATKRLKSTLQNLKQRGHIKYDSSKQRYLATRPTSPLMVARAKLTDNGIELSPVRWTGSKATTPFMMVKKSDTEYKDIKDGDKLLVAIQSTHMSVIDGNRKKPVARCSVLQRLSADDPVIVRAVFNKNANDAPTLTPAFRTTKGTHVPIHALRFEGPYSKDDYPENAEVLVRLSEKTSQHAIHGTITDLAEWNENFPASLLSKRDKANASFMDDIYSPEQEARAEAISRKAPKPSHYKDMRKTIQFAVDPEDAKDRDDAISAKPDTASDNQGGYIVTVSDIDVTRLVTQMTETLESATRHPLSAYTNDAVVHMLPKSWAEGAASLINGENRFCVSVDIRIDAQGEKLDHHVYRSLNAPHQTSYNRFDEVLSGGTVEGFNEEMVQAANHIFAAYEALVIEDSNRQALNFNQARYYVENDEGGRIKGIKSESESGSISRDIIKKFMVAASRAFREECGIIGANTIDRVESEPNIHERLPKNILNNKEAQFLNRIWSREEILGELEKHANDPAMEQAISDLLIQRVMRPGRFTTTEVGHFGMGLTDEPYAAFNSPVRALDNLVNQMSLFERKGWLADYADQETIEWLDKNFLSPQAQAGIAEFMNGEQPQYKRLQREAMRRQAIAHLHQYEGKTISACFQHVTDNEMSLKLEDCARPFMLPLSAISGAAFESDVLNQQITDSANPGRMIKADQWMDVKLQLADPLSNRLIMSIPDQQPKIEKTPPQRQEKTSHQIIVKAKVLEATTKSIRIKIGNKELDLSTKMPGSRSARRGDLYHYNTGITLIAGEKQNFRLRVNNEGELTEAIPTNNKRLDKNTVYTQFLKANAIEFKEPVRPSAPHERRPWLGLEALASHPLAEHFPEKQPE